MVDSNATPPRDDRPSLLAHLRQRLSLPHVQATLGIIAALFSIGGALYGYLRPARVARADQGEVFAIVREARSGHAVEDATVELLTPDNALVTTLPATSGANPRRVKEGAYRLRVTHPRYATETRQIQIVAGQTSEIQVRLAPRPPTSPPVARPVEPAAGANPVERSWEGLKKLFH